jgi:hypothetical protein
MLDMLTQWITAIANFWNHYTDAGCITVAALCAWCVAAVVEAYFVPLNWPIRKQKELTVVVTIAISWIAGASLWWATDPADPLRVRVIVTGVLSLVSPVSYVWVAKLLTKYFPAIGSVWSLEQPK